MRACRSAVLLEWPPRRGRQRPMWGAGSGRQACPGHDGGVEDSLASAQVNRSYAVAFGFRCRFWFRPTITAEGQRAGCPTDSPSIVILRSDCDPVQSVRPRDPLQPSSILTFRSIPSALSRIRAHRPIAPQRGIRKCPLCGPTKATILELSRDWLFLPLRGTAAHDATNDSSARIESRRTAVHDFVAHTKLHGPAQGNHATEWHRVTRLLGLPLIRRQIYCPVCRYSPAPCLCRAPRRSRDRRRRRPASRFLP